MLRSSFYGLETAKSAVMASQTALDVVGQNVANANTEGYTRQTVSQSAANYNVNSSKYAKLVSVGQGVVIEGIGQIRDEFLDVRFRKASSEYGTLAKRLSIHNDIDILFDNTDKDGLEDRFTDFLAQLQTLSSNAGDVEFSSIVRSSAKKIAETLNQYADTLNDIREQEISDLSINVGDINSLTQKIEDINKSIRNEKLQGGNINELLDKRNLFLDELSGYLNITVEANSDGTVSVKTGDEYLVDAQNNTHATLSVNVGADEVQVLLDGSTFEIQEGQLKGALQLLNGKGGYASATEENYVGLPYYQKALDDLAASFAQTFNDLNGTGKPLFSGTTAATISISAGWIADANYITSTTDPGGEEGKNNNIVLMINAMSTSRTISPLFNGTFNEFASSLMDQSAVDCEYVTDLEETSKLLLTSLDNQRESVKGVSIEEETVNVIKFQKAFQAASRLMTALDEMLDTIINRMGTVGR